MAKTLFDISLLQLQLPQLLLITFTAFLSILFLKHKIASNFKSLNLPPGPPKLPIIGNLHQWSKLPHHSLLELSRKYGPIMQLQLGYVPALIISSPDTAKQVLKTNDLDTCTRPTTTGTRKLSYGHIDIAFSPYNDYWRETRKIFMVELMGAKRAHSLRNAREEEVTRLIGLLSRNAGNSIELDGKIFELLDGIVASVAFGKFYGRDQFGGKNNFQQVFNEAMKIFGSFSAEDFFPTWWGRGIDKWSGYSSRLQKSFRDLDGYFQMLLDKHRSPEMSGRIENEDFVDVLIALQKDSDKSHLTDRSIKALIMDIFLGATDTTSVTILWAMAELMKNPRVMNKLQAEIRSCTREKKQMVEESDIANLNYLKMVVKETLRLHPAGPLLIPHEAIRHFKIGGYDVFPGTRIFVNAWAIGRDPNSWQNPEEFDPDRFEGKDIDFKGQNFTFLPFGSGRRICPGITLGVGTVEFALANMLYCFDWKLPEGIECEEMSMEEQGGGITVHRKELLHVVPIKYVRTN